jgi:hypothetical protein
MWLIVGVVVVSGLAMIVAGRFSSGGDRPLADDIDDRGLVANEQLVPWHAVYRVELVTGRTLRGTWYRFDVRSEDIPELTVEGAGRLGERFLAHSYHLPGFDHVAVTDGLTRRVPLVVCFSR